MTFESDIPQKKTADVFYLCDRKEQAGTSDEKRSTCSFHSLSVKGHVTVIYRHSNEPSLCVRGNTDTVNSITTTIDNHTLTITAPTATTDSIVVTCGSKELRDVILHDSGTVDIHPNSKAMVRAVNHGTGHITLYGYSVALSAYIKGQGSIDASRLHASLASLSIQGSGDIRAIATEALHAVISGDGNITVFGNPLTRKVSRVGAGRINFCSPTALK